MNYERIYNQIIERGKQRLLEGYGENHHIIPRCMGGADTQDNIVRLTAREHFICHWLLVRIYPTNVSIKRAAFLMSTYRKSKVSARTYQELKEGLTPWNKGKPMHINAQKALAVANKGNTYRTGMTHTEETKLKMSESSKGIPAHNKGKSKLTQHREEILKAYVKNKQSVSSLAKKYNTTTQTITRFLKKENVFRAFGRGRVNKKN